MNSYSPAKKESAKVDQRSWTGSLVPGLRAQSSLLNNLAECGYPPPFSGDLCYNHRECDTPEDMRWKSDGWQGSGQRFIRPRSPSGAVLDWWLTTLLQGCSSASACSSRPVKRGNGRYGFALAWGGEHPAPRSRALAIVTGIPTAACFLVARCLLAQVDVRGHVCPGLFLQGCSLPRKGACLCWSRAHAGLPGAKCLPTPWENMTVFSEIVLSCRTSRKMTSLVNLWLLAVGGDTWCFAGKVL